MPLIKKVKKFFLKKKQHSEEETAYMNACKIMKGIFTYDCYANRYFESNLQGWVSIPNWIQLLDMQNITKKHINFHLWNHTYFQNIFPITTT